MTPVALSLLTAARAMMQIGGVWDDQRPDLHPTTMMLLQDWDALVGMVGLFTEDELQAIISQSASEVNAWLEARGFSCRLNDEGSRGRLYLAAYLKLLASFLVPGDDEYVVDERPDKKFFRLTKEAQGVTFYRVNGEPGAFASIPSKRKGLKLWLGPIPGNLTDSTPRDRAQALVYASWKWWLNEVNFCQDDEFNGLVAPWVRVFETPVDLDALVGVINYSSESGLAMWVISQAIGAFKFEFKPTGFRFENVVAMTARNLSVSPKEKKPYPKDLVFHGPFSWAITIDDADGKPQLVAAGAVGVNDMRNWGTD